MELEHLVGAGISVAPNLAGIEVVTVPIELDDYILDHLRQAAAQGETPNRANHRAALEDKQAPYSL